jgi:spore germination cell wall hydrolase CwlJ-like protein
MKIFANQPMKAVLYVISALGIIFALLFVHQVREAEHARAVALKEQQRQKAAKLAQVKPVDPKQLKCLTDNIYYEAGNQGTVGQAAVGRVTINRVHYGFGRSVCEVVYHKTRIERGESEDGTPISKIMCQFSWVCDEFRPGVNRATYAQSHQVAYQILSTDAWNDLLPRNTLYFHATHISPNWGLQKVKSIGQHVFYTNNKIVRVKNKSN